MKDDYDILKELVEKAISDYVQKTYLIEEK